jgi:hypothetical protein
MGGGGKINGRREQRPLYGLWLEEAGHPGSGGGAGGNT